MPEVTARYTNIRPSLDGTLSGPAWAGAAWSPRFVDLADGGPAVLDTRVALLWDEGALYCGFRVEDPFPNAVLGTRDQLIFQENDVEIFIDGGDCYYELELNALNTVYEVFFIWQDAYRRGSRFDVPEFDLLDQGALSFAGDYDRQAKSFWTGTHPRGPRWAFRNWDFPGLVTAVHIDGVLNDPATVSRGWTAEIKLPWAGMGPLGHGRQIPPAEGDRWRMFLSRFQQIPIAGRTVQAAWGVDAHGIYDSHLPERWTSVVFSTDPAA